MTLNQDDKQKELLKTMNGIDVMKDLSIDYVRLLHFAREGLLLPHHPSPKNKYIIFGINPRYYSPKDIEDIFFQWIYLKSDVKDFKLKYKDLLEGLRQQMANTVAESQKPSKLESKYFSEAGKKGGEKEKKNKPILEAVKQFMRYNPKITNNANENIAKKFCNKFKEASPMSVTIDQVKYEVFCGGGIIVSRHGERYDVIKGDNKEKSIAYSTFRVRYIPDAKKELSVPE